MKMDLKDGAMDILIININLSMLIIMVCRKSLCIINK